MTERRTIEIVSSDSHLELSPWYFQEKDASGRPIGERLIPYDTALDFIADEFIFRSRSSCFLPNHVLSKWSDASKNPLRMPLASDSTDSDRYDFSASEVLVIPLKGPDINALINFQDGRLFSSYELEIRPMLDHPVVYCAAEKDDGDSYSIKFQLFVPSDRFYEFRSLILNRVGCKLTVTVEGLGGVYRAARMTPKPYQALVFEPHKLQVEGFESIRRSFPKMDFFSAFFGNPSSVIRGLSIGVCCAPNTSVSSVLSATTD